MPSAGTTAHHVIYAGALDIAVGPRWYSTYEMACNLVKMNIEGEALARGSLRRRQRG